MKMEHILLINQANLGHHGLPLHVCNQRIALEEKDEDDDEYDLMEFDPSFSSLHSENLIVDFGFHFGLRIIFVSWVLNYTLTLNFMQTICSFFTFAHITFVQNLSKKSLEKGPFPIIFIIIFIFLIINHQHFISMTAFIVILIYSITSN